MKPIVSVICITYNHEKYIAQALEGFLMQKTNFTFEILIHDDASTDSTADIIREYKKQNKNINAIIKPIYEKQNQYSSGMYDFINDMIKSANGKYLAFCEGDDYWTDPQKLQKQVDFLNSQLEYAVCFHPVRVFFDNGEEKEFIFPNAEKMSKFTLENLLKENFIQSNSVMYRKQNYRDMPNNVMPQDWFLHLYHAKFGKIGFINKTMSSYRRHSGGVWWGSHKDSRSLWKKHGLAHVRVFSELLKLYESEPKYKKIIVAHMHDLLKKFIEVDKKYGDNLLQKVIIELPGMVEAVMISQHELHQKEVRSLHEHMDEQAKIVKHLTNELNDKNRQYDHAMQELSRANKEIAVIQKSLTWRVKSHLPIGRKR